MLWAGNTVSVKMGGTGITAWHANFIRFIIAWPILAATSALTRAPDAATTPSRARAYRSLVPVSIAEACVGSSLFVYGLAHTDLAVGATLSSLAPLMSVPFALLYREERWSPPRFAAVTATVAGVVMPHCGRLEDVRAGRRRELELAVVDALVLLHVDEAELVGRAVLVRR